MLAVELVIGYRVQ